MSLAYVILAHREPARLARLAGRLLENGDHAVVHVDRKAPLAPFEEALAPYLRTGRLQMARRRVKAHWADYSLVDATLAIVEQALEEFSFTHVVLLSGDAYPLASARTLRAFFDLAKERSFMFHSDGSDGVRPSTREGNLRWYWNGDLRRMTYRHYRVLGRQVHLPNRYVPSFPRLAPPSDLRLYQGSQWWALSRDAARYAVETFIRRPELRRFFRRTQAPDEFALHTVLGNSPLLPTLVNDDLHYVHWDGWHPRPLTMPDLTPITASDKLFARKVDDRRLLDELDKLSQRRDEQFEPTVARLRDRHLTDDACSKHE